MKYIPKRICIIENNKLSDIINFIKSKDLDCIIELNGQQLTQK